MVNNVLRTGTLLDEKRTDQQSMSAKAIANIREAIDHSPDASTRPPPQ